jgi:amino acid adenylation domain-containing protein/FkbM family methyltransferase
MSDKPIDSRPPSPSLSDLSDAKRALLARRLAERAAAKPAAIPPRADASRAPLSGAQEEIWLQEERSSGMLANNLANAWRVRGSFDESAFRRALDGLVRRHEILHTTFTLGPEGPEQRIQDARPVEVEMADVRISLDDAERLVHAWSQRKFDIGRDQLLRAGIARIADDDHVVFLVMHHIAADGVSRGILLEELSALYAAERRGDRDALPPVTTQYGDFAAWERGESQQRQHAKQVERWRERMRGAPEALDMPTDRPRGAAAEYEGRTCAEILSPAVLSDVRALAQRYDATTFMVLFSAFATLLARYSGQDDVVIGIPVAGRNRPELERAIGFYANTIGIRTDLSGDPTFAELIGRVRGRVLDAFDDQDVPFTRVMDALRRDGRPANAPLFQVMFALQNLGTASLALEGAILEPMPVWHGGTKFELTLLASERAEGLRLGLEHRIDLFDAATAERIVEHLGRLITAAVAAPDTRISALPLMSDAERTRILETWNDTNAAWPTTATLHGLFEEQVRRRPQAVAVQDGHDTLTYAELDRRANRLAWALRDRGVGPDALVAVCMEKSVGLVAVLLGILKAGGAYVPIDPVYPDDRIAFMLADCEASIVVTEPSLAARVAAQDVEKIVAVDVWADATTTRDHAPPPVAGPSNLCYVIYTSGSTGRPKGVLIEHRNVVRLLFNDRFQFDFSERDVWTVFHSFSFDFSVWEMYGALLYGGRLVVVPRDVAQQSADFLTLLAREGVTVLNQVPSAFYALMEEELSRPTRNLGLRYVIFGGEALQPSLLREWKARYPATSLINMFGITETTVHVTFKQIGDAEIADGASNIGRPIPTLTTYVLDDRLQIVPFGVTGEICVGGAGVARGYLKRPELTAERFIAHPFRAGERMYRSGDLGRQRSDGEIEYLGRRDAQVKLRGFRIELGEIEATLAQHPAVAQAAVLLRQERGGELVAYVVPDADRAGPVRRLAAMDLATAPPRFDLPNGMTVFQRNKSESEFLFKEIFEGEGYLRHGLTISEGDVVFDVGANVGFFTVFAGTQVPGSRVYAFEPIPPVFDALRANAEVHGVAGRVFRCGLGSREETVEFTYYPENTVLSGRFASAEGETEVVRRYLTNVEATAAGGGSLDELLSHKLRGEQYTCSIRTLSDVVREEGVERIDLLKIDVEKAEWDVLLGIADGDWPKIQQIVIEVHDLGGRLEQVLTLFRSKGFECIAEEEDMLVGTGLYGVYAWRPNARRPKTVDRRPPRWSGATALREELERHLEQDLPEYMVPSAIVFLDALPLTSSGKLDRRALPAPHYATHSEDLPPKGPIEEVVASVWRQALQIARVGRTTSFFELGGHSLLVTRVVGALAKLLRVQLPIRTMFESPTVAGVAAALVARETTPGQTAKVAELVLKLQLQGAPAASAPDTKTHA